MKNNFQKIWRPILIIFFIFLLWKIIIIVTSAPHYILPSPENVLKSLYVNYNLLFDNAIITITEILLGLVFGILLGSISAILIASFQPARLWVLPIIVGTQAVPVFTIAPLLVLWFGYGMISKVLMATIIIYFPIVANFVDGLQQTDKSLIDLAKTMTKDTKYRKIFILFHIKIPSALPSLASGIRVAAAVAPIGAIVGEWVGSGAGLGYLMIQANARVQTDLMFAALLITALVGIVLYFSIDILLKNLITWKIT